MSKKGKQLQIATDGMLDLQLKEQRRTVDFDTFDIQVQELMRMLEDGQIWIAPAYQRKFRWDEERSSQLIESILLGIPIPSLMMATNQDNTWEVVDGVQRLSSIAKFFGNANLREKLKVGAELKLTELSKLDAFDGITFETLPSHIQTHFKTRPIKVITLNDKSDKVVRFDLFERLNTGGVALSDQEIRDCVYQGQFSDKLGELSEVPEFMQVIRLTPLQRRDGTAEECVLRFFAFLHRYKQFDHSVKDFLTDYMEASSEKFDFKSNERLFRQTFAQLAGAFPDGITRLQGRNRTPLNLFEGVSVGAALALQRSDHLVTEGIPQWMAHPKLREYTTGATNSQKAVKGRIEFCRDRFLGAPYVEPAEE